MSRDRAASLDWVTCNLIEQLGGEYTAMADRAETLIAIAERYHVLTETLVAWIHIATADKEWSAAEWRAWCERFIVAREELLALHSVN